MLTRGPQPQAPPEPPSMISPFARRAHEAAWSAVHRPVDRARAEGGARLGQRGDFLRRARVRVREGTVFLSGEVTDFASFRSLDALVCGDAGSAIRQERGSGGPGGAARASGLGRREVGTSS